MPFIHKTFKMNNKLVALIFIILIASIVGISMYKRSVEEEMYNFKIYFFNAGKDDCILISNNDNYIKSLANKGITTQTISGLEILQKVLISHIFLWYNKICYKIDT